MDCIVHWISTSVSPVVGAAVAMMILVTIRLVLVVVVPVAVLVSALESTTMTLAGHWSICYCWIPVRITPLVLHLMRPVPAG